MKKKIYRPWCRLDRTRKADTPPAISKNRSLAVSTRLCELMATRTNVSTPNSNTSQSAPTTNTARSTAPARTGGSPGPGCPMRAMTQTVAHASHAPPRKCIGISSHQIWKYQSNSRARRFAMKMKSIKPAVARPKVRLIQPEVYHGKETPSLRGGEERVSL